MGFREDWNMGEGTGRRPTLRMQNLPFQRSLINACCLDTFNGEVRGIECRL
jgi:hypothetical protein